MLKKNWKKEIIDFDMAKRYDESKEKETKNDIDLMDSLIAEVNKCGYNLKYIFELSYINNEDRILLPIIIKYIGKFDNVGISCDLMRALAYRGFTECTEFLLDQFKRTDLQNDGSCIKQSYRESSSAAISEIRDKRFINEYINLINNPETHDDTYFLIELLGVLKSEEALPLLIELLNDKNHIIKCATLRALVYYKNSYLTQFIEPLLNDKNKTVQDHAKKAIKRLSSNT